jgi:hypothetical protein
MIYLSIIFITYYFIIIYYYVILLIRAILLIILLFLTTSPSLFRTAMANRYPRRLYPGLRTAQDDRCARLEAEVVKHVTADELVSVTPVRSCLQCKQEL